MRAIPAKHHGFLIALALVVALLATPWTSLAVEDETAPEPAATPDRSPSYSPDAPAGALRLPGGPPPVGDALLEDGLTAPGPIPGGVSCPGTRNVAEFVGEGYIIKIGGKCRPENSQAAMVLPAIPGLNVPDGEIRFEAKVATGGDRTTIWAMFRDQAGTPQHYLLAAIPEAGRIGVLKEGFDQPSVSLVTRNDLARKLAGGGWHEYAIRLQGPNFWVLVDGDLVLSVSDDALDRGGLRFGVRRLGNADDDVEAGAVLRNLRVSRLSETP